MKLLKLISVMLVLATGLMGQTTEDMKSQKDKKYVELWKEVNSFREKNLPKSALETVDKIYQLAKKEKNEDQIIKAFIHKMLFSHSFEENAFEGAIKEIKTEIKNALFPSKNIYCSMLAEMYMMYYNANRWKWHKRSATANFDNEDIKTWSLQDLVNEVIKNYELSLSETEKLQNTPINTYNEIIKWGNKPMELRPTLYDFLAHRALDYFINTNIDISRPAEQFELREDFYFSSTNDFLNQTITSDDSLSYKYRATLLLQELLRFTIKNKNENAIIDADLKRLQFAYRYSININKDDMYLKSLEVLADQYPNSIITSMVLAAEAVFYRDRAAEYKPNEESKKYKDYNLKALDICEKALQKFPKSEGADDCREIQWGIKAKQMNFTAEQYIAPDKKFPIKVDFKNVDKVYIRAISLDREKVDKIKDLYGEDYYKMLEKIGSPFYTSESALPFINDYNPNSTEIIINSFPAGLYLLSLSTGQDFTSKREIVAHHLLNVTNISFISQKINNYFSEYYVVDRDNGALLEGVDINVYKEVYDYKKSRYRNDKIGSYQTKKDGYFPLKVEDNEWVRIKIDFSKGKNFLSTGDSYSRYTEPQEKVTYLTTFFLDRAIYRPGQTIFFKGIMVEKREDKCSLITARNTTITLFDPNYQKVSDLTLISNEYGTFNGSFTIPMGLLNGQYRISNEHGTIFFRVEEYKRPTFEVELKPFAGNYILNDTVKINGAAKMLAGANLTGAKVSYRITRLPQWRGWWYYYIKAQPVQVANGTLATGDDGEFQIKFKAIPDYSYEKSDFVVFNYGITIDVTDINGETQSASKSITIGYKSLVVSTEIPQMLNKEQILTDYKDGFRINTLNLNGEFLPAKGKMVFYSLIPPAKVMKAKKWEILQNPVYTREQWEKLLPGLEYNKDNEITNWKKDKIIAEIDFNTATAKYFTPKDFEKWKSGAYVIEITSMDNFNNPVENKNFFTLYSTKETKLPYPVAEWFSSVKDYCEPGETAKFMIGSGYDNINMLYEIEHKGKIVERKWLNISKEQKLIEIPVKEEHRGNFAVHFAFMKDNAYYTYSQTITVPYSNKQLDIKFETFRDKLQPGQSEEWRIKLKGPKGEKVAAEMLASMYDASLDKFAANYWYFDIYNRYYSSIYLNPSPLNTGVGIAFSPDEALPYSKNYYYNTFNWFGFSYYGFSGYANGVPSPSMVKSARKDKKEAPRTEEVGAQPPEASKADGDEEKSADMVSDKKNGKQVGGISGKSELAEVKVRTNFNETAFFYPNLYTNDSGEVVVSFKIPESLTRWKMQGLAHTKDLKYGYTTNTLVTQKELMVMPNAPRFFRENDLMEFPVKIASLSDKDVKGSAQIKFFEAATMKEINILNNEIDTKDFSLKAGQNTLLTWKIKIPESVSSIVYRIVAKAANFSDGEEKIIPVLTNRMLVMESLPLPIRGITTKNYELKKLMQSSASGTLKNYKLTLEFTSNPAWYAVQALPYIMEFPYECNEQLFSRFYANSIATSIANSSPDIKRIFDIWRTSAKGESLMSNLEKNQELKSLLLEETPWVMQAQDENERKHRVGLLFELNRMSNELRTAFNKLEQAQVYNGAWPWFKGMPEDRYITQHIICGLGKLNHIKCITPDFSTRVTNMANKALVYLDDMIQRDYNELKRYYNESELKDNHLSYTAIHYLYTRSFYKDIPVSERAKEAFNYFKGQAEKYWTKQGLYSDGMIALALHRYGNTKTTNDIVKSLRELSLTSDEMGMYWKDNIGGYYWYQAPIETQALMVEVFDEAANDETAVNDLKVWLLKQKQTQDWKTTKATVEAVYAILLRGKDWLTATEQVEILIGNKKIEDYPGLGDIYKQAEAGTGYIKTSWNKDEIKPEMGSIKLKKNNQGVSWGALYWQYFEQLDKITPHETPLKLNKKLFIERIGKNGKFIEPITDKTKLKVGDKVIVRIELRVDRMMEYVHLKDMRASGFEPINVLSVYKYQDGLGYYESTKDAATNFFISYLPKGTFVFEYPLRVTHKGDFSNGITTIQCMYAPEFSSHSEGIRVKVDE